MKNSATISAKYFVASSIAAIFFSVFIILGLGYSLANIMPDNFGAKQIVYLLIICSALFIMIFGFLFLLFLNKYVKCVTNLKLYGQIDEVSGVFSRPRLLSDLEREAKSASRRSTKLSICVIQLDNLMIINDKFGRDAGDRLLYALGLTSKTALRDTDFFGRLSGIQFCAVYPNIGGHDANIARLRLANSICEIRHSSVHGEISIIAKIGLAEFKQGDSVNRLIERAINSLAPI